MLFRDEASGVCTEDGIIDFLSEDHLESTEMAEITKEQFDSFGDNGLPKKALKKRVFVEIEQKVKITPKS